MKKLFWAKTLFALALAILVAVGSASAEPWKFGVMSDTQWTTADPSGMNPNGVSVSIIDQINPQFINHGVKFVIQVGDLTENGADADIAARANAAQALYNAGIGFFPMRGNHETYTSGNSFGIPAVQTNFPQTQCVGPHVFGATNCTSPTLPNPYSNDLLGMSYSFDYGHHGNNARFVIIDDWVTPNKLVTAAGYTYGWSIAEQQGWISERLNKITRGTAHAFVFSHQNLIGENHQDSLFQGYTNANPAMQNAFFASLDTNDVKYYISGHDHIHQRSIIKSPDGLSKVQEIIGASNSSKFYTPKALDHANWFGQKVRETSVSQERYAVGYYIYTVDGPCVTVDYYSDNHGNWASDNCYPDGTTPQSCTTPGSHITPTFNFVKKETWGYCQNGQEFLVPQTKTYTTVEDSFEGTTARILDGTSNSTATDDNNRAFTKTVNTGWVDVDRWCEKYPPHRWHPQLDLASNILKLQGMTDLGKDSTDIYALSLSYDHHRLLPIQLGKGLLGLVTRDENGNWVNAVDKNVGGTKKFVLGPWKSGYGLGTYGVDLKARTVWAVINHDGDFAAAGFRHFK
jgi:hypothetical protein